MTSQNCQTAPFPTCCLTNGSALVATINVFKEHRCEVLSFSLLTDLGWNGQAFVSLASGKGQMLALQG